MDTKEAIQNEFLREYAAKDFDHITVKGICSMAPVARTTFYAYYQNTDELLEEIEDELIGGLRKVTVDVSGGDLPTMDFDAFLQRTIEYIRAHWDRFTALLIAQPDRRFEEKLKAAIKAHFAMRYPDKRFVANYDLICEIMASAVLGGYRWWLQHPQQVQEENLKRVVTQTLEQLVVILQ